MTDVNKPALRFEGFEEVWVYYKLADIGNIQTGNTPPTKNSENYDESGTLWITPTDIKSNITTETQKKLSELGKSRARIADSGSILVTCIASIGKNTLIINECGFNQQINSLTPFNSFDSYFLFSQSYFWSKIMKTIAASGTMQIINKTEFSNLTFLFPKPTEQIKIGNFFKKLDNTIELQQQEIELLKKQKSGLLQKMFPKNGEDKPELRFEGFTDTWEQRKLGELGSVAMNKRIFKDETTDNGEIPFYKIGTFGSIPDSFISRELFDLYKSKYPYPEKGDLLISASGSIGRIVEYQGKEEYFQDSNIVWLKHDERLINSFLKQFYSIVKWNGLEGSTIKRLYNKNILETEIRLPSVKEQTKIGNFFKQLDDTITLQEQQLEKLKEMKKGYLQQMFI